MFGSRIKLFSLLGFDVKIDLSWIILFMLISWTLSKGLFPFYYGDLATSTYWYMGVASALGLFLSIIIHEFSHSLVARQFGIPMQGITLFIFGGVAEMKDEPPSAKAEFFMAIAGPLSSIAIGAAIYGLFQTNAVSALSLPVRGVFMYLAGINIILAVFNLFPAFPLDGGRVLRSILWRWKNDLKWATRIAAAMGSFFGLLLIFLGIFSFINGDFIGGMWWFLIGMFLRGAAQASYRQVLTRKALEGEMVRRFMVKDPVSVTPSLTVGQLVNDYVFKYHYKMFPVTEQESPVGCITIKQLEKIPKDEWGRHTVSELASRASPENTISPDADAVDALAIMNRTGNTRLMVVEDKKLIGIISLKDMLKFLSLKMELESGRAGAGAQTPG